MQVRGAGERARSLKVRGEEIWRRLLDWAWGRECVARAYLVGRVAYADIEVREVGLYHVSEQDF